MSGDIAVERRSPPAHFFDDVERWPREALDRLQLERLRAAIGYAYAAEAFYHSLWDRAGVGPDGVRSLDDLGRYPIVTKKDLLAAGASQQRTLEAPVGFSTRGTSGEPLLLWLGPEEEEAYLVPTVRGFVWAGLRAGDTALLMSPVWHRLAACEAHAVFRLGGRAVFPWGSLTPGFVREFVAALRDFEPQFVTTTAPFLLSVVRGCDDEGEDVSRLFRTVRSVVVVGQPLTPGLRLHLKERLGVGDVFERAGTQEGAALDECGEHVAPHVHEDVCLLEVLSDDRAPVPAGSRGRLVVTKLVPGGSPFVRYDTGDLAAFVPGACPCGRTFRRLKIFGRPETSVVVGGRVVTAYDARLRVDADADLVGRNLLLVRDRSRASTTLCLAIEGEATNAAALEERLRAGLGVARVEILWLGGVRLGWSFRQVANRSELGLADSAQDAPRSETAVRTPREVP